MSFNLYFAGRGPNAVAKYKMDNNLNQLCSQLLERSTIKEYIAKCNDIHKAKLFIDSGAYDKSVNYMNDLFKQTRDSIDKITINKEYKDLFLGFINFLEIRNK